MVDGLIPKRPNNDGEHKIPANDKECISYVVAFGVGNETAFARFHPEFLDESGKLTKAGKTQCRQFFSYAKNKEYADDYRSTLETFAKGKTQAKSTSTDTGESRTERAVKKLMSDVLDSIEYNNNLDPEALKDFVEVAKKLGVLKDEEETQIRPLRFLPELCFSSCRYRLFVENAVKGGAVIDECQFCKALAYATENGYKDDATNRLNIPKEVLDAEPKNTIKTLDILAGKIKN